MSMVSLGLPPTLVMRRVPGLLCTKRLYAPTVGHGASGRTSSVVSKKLAIVSLPARGFQVVAASASVPGKRERKTRLARLKSVPGIGPKYESLLVGVGIKNVDDLKRLHYEVNSADATRTKHYLQEVVGMRNSTHINAIVQFLSQQHPLSLTQQQGTGTTDGLRIEPKVTLSVEGNISAGKSTFLRLLENTGILEDKLQVVPEPVEKWQNVGNGQVNLLMEFYQQPERMAYTFQNYVFLTRVVQERESYTASQMCRLLERSVFSDRMVFVRAVHAAKYMNDTELAIYDSWFDPMLNTLPTLVPNGFIYLRAQPGTCHQRLKKRARSEETSVQLSYLEELHAKHEDWLFDGADQMMGSKHLWVPSSNQVLLNSKMLQAGGNRSLVLPKQQAPGPQSQLILSDKPPSGGSYSKVQLPDVPAALRGSVRFLDTSKGAHMHALLNQIPALVLDCDADVDVEQDTVYKQHVANQVSEYVDYVRDYVQARGQATALANPSNYVEPFNGYYLKLNNGPVLYMDRHAPLIAHAVPQVQQQVQQLRTSIEASTSSTITSTGEFSSSTDLQALVELEQAALAAGEMSTYDTTFSIDDSDHESTVLGVNGHVMATLSRTNGFLSSHLGTEENAALSLSS